MTVEDEDFQDLEKHAPSNVIPMKRRKTWRQATGEVLFEMDVANRLVEMFGDRIRYAEGIGWLIWKGTHWQRDGDEAPAVRELVKQVVSLLRVEAAETGSDELWALAQKTGTARGVGAVVSLAKSDARIRVSVDDLDSHPTLLACTNGTIDLETGELYVSKPDDLLTRCAPTQYNPDARHDGFERLLRHLIPTEDARAYMQIAAGYSITGNPVEDVIFLLIGAKRAGKGTFLRALREALGEHYTETGMGSFCVDRRNPGGNAPRSDLHRLIGRRVVAASEIHPGQTFDSGRLKAMAGGERLVVRTLHQPEVEAPVSFTIWLIANDGDLPRMRPEDDALWERVRRIPVGVTVPEEERDPAFRESMGTEEAKAAALAWLVQGAIDYHANGLGSSPQSVQDAKQELREEMDDLGPFITAHIVFDPNAIEAKSAIRAAVETWADGENVPPAKQLKGALMAAAERVGVTIKDTTTSNSSGKRVSAWRGVRLAL